MAGCRYRTLLDFTISLMIYYYYFFLHVSDWGLIKIIKANHGRTDTNMWKTSQISNMHCFRVTPLHTVSDLHSRETFMYNFTRVI